MPEAKKQVEVQGETGAEQGRRTISGRTRPYLLTLPAFIIPLGIVLVWIVGIYYSLTDFDLRHGIRNYIGLENFVYLVTKDRVFWPSVWTTVKYSLVALIIEVPLGLAVALLLDRVTGWTARIARAVIVAPLCIAPVVATLMWKIMMGPTQGILNYALRVLGLPAVDWLGNPRVALFSMVLIDVWIFTPFIILVFWGGLQSLPKAPYEAALVDGASSFFIFRKLTLPMIKPFAVIALLFRACDTLNAFDTIYSSTKGGPVGATRTLNVLAVDNVMRWNHVGYGLAIVMVTYFLVYAVAKRLMTLWPR